MKGIVPTPRRLETEQLLDLAAERIKAAAADIETALPAKRRATLLAVTEFLADLDAIAEVHR